MLKALIAQQLADAWHAAGLEGRPPDAQIAPSDRAEFGDYTSNLALVAAGPLGIAPRELGTRLAERLDRTVVAAVDVAGPGFLNLFLEPDVVREALRAILGADGRFREGDGKRGTLQVEFVSSNPTGPLTVGHGRQAVLGDVLASLYAETGYDVQREYYFNDAGRQVDLLAESLWARFRQALGESRSVPEEGYQGAYLIPLANELVEAWGDVHPEFDEAARVTFRDAAVDRIRGAIREDLDILGVAFDQWFSETSLHRSGEVQAALDALTDAGGTYVEEGATWLAAERHGGDRDAVLLRSDGRPTYLLVDIAYHLNKHRRGFARVIDVQGSDHHAEQQAVLTALRILGLPEGFLDYAVHQMVSLKTAGETMRMSTRGGRFVTLRSLLDELGRDTVRYFMIARKPSNHLDFDLDLARSESLDNPVTYIQYAHTRIASILRNAEAEDTAAARVDRLEHPDELALIRLLDELPNTVREAAEGFAPHLLAEYALTLSRRFHAYYTDHRVLGEDRSLMQSRLSLVRGVQIVLRRCLELLRMDAPEAM
jgi:arginyl-tRNA synthetase